MSRFIQKVAITVFMAGILATQIAATPARTSARFRLSYRTLKPNAGHFKTEKEAVATKKTLDQLGCATKTAQHDGHIDVSYECKFWKSLTLKDAKEVAQWDKWLTTKGFAVVQNTPSKDHKETVKYHLNDWRTLHFDKVIEAKAHIEMFKMLGCEVTSAKHNGHEDVRFRCTSWQILGVPNHQEAHAWMSVLKKYGFATLHEH